MADVNLRISASDPSDIYSRYHGLAIDGVLPENFWIVDPALIIGTSGTPFTYNATLSGLADGPHTATYGNSGYTWTGDIYIDGVLAASGPVSRTGPVNLTAAFVVGAPRPGRAPADLPDFTIEGGA